MTRVLLSNAHLTLSYDEATGLVRYTRTRVAFATLDEVRSVNAEVIAHLPSGGAPKLLIDLREAPARNDEAFEAEISRTLLSILPRFAATAVLVKSAVGRLQTNRLARERGGVAVVFGTEAEALAYLSAP